MSTLPVFHTEDRDLHLLQTSWSSLLNPVLSNAISNGVLISNVNLNTGANAINHKLGRKLQGWIVVRLRAAASIYDTQDSNLTPTLTLSLVSSTPVLADLYVF